EPLLEDDNSVVRRHAATAARELGDAAQVLLPALERAYRAEADELAAETIGWAIFRLTPEERRVDAVNLLNENAIGWRRISYLVEELGLDEALTVLARTGIRSDEDERLLSEIA